jgi:hypothetical protein
VPQGYLTQCATFSSLLWDGHLARPNLAFKYVRARYLTPLGNLEHRINREQLVQKLEQAPDDLVQVVLNFSHQLKAIRNNHPRDGHSC